MARDQLGGDVHALAGAYALDALDDLERAAFARHLAGCEVCAVEVAELQETAGRMAAANWSVPPPRMRDAVLAEVSRTRQAAGGRRDDSRRAHIAAARWRRRTAMAVAAGILAAGGGVATWAVTQQRVRDEHARVVAEQQRQRDISAVLSAPDVRLGHDGQVTVVMSASRDAAVVVLGDLRDPGPAHAYQLWAIRPGDQMTPVGLLRPGQRTGTVLVTKMAGADGVGVSLEPAGGSAQPTVVVQTVRLA